MLSSYYQLTKPGIVKGNLYATLGGFFLAARGIIDFSLLISTVLGTIFIIASGCVFNNILDRKIDSKMKRTQKRALVTGEISKENAFIFGGTLLIFSVLIFMFFTNLLTTIIAITGFIFYVVVYGYFKRQSDIGTLVGSISGSIPPVIGCTAVTKNLDMGAILLFFIMAAWQMPHFYSIAIFRLSEYEKASIPILSITRGIKTTKTHIIYFIIAFIILSPLLTVFGYTGYIYLMTMLIIGLVWLFKAVKGISEKDDNAWATKMFTFSLLVLTVFCIMISIDFLMPF